MRDVRRGMCYVGRKRYGLLLLRRRRLWRHGAPHLHGEIIYLFLN